MTPSEPSERTIAYLSMEIGLESGMHTSSGGLGILAGDFMRSAADLRIPMVGMTLLHRQGYVRQLLDADGWQIDEPDPWTVEASLDEVPGRVAVTLEGRTVHIRAWHYTVRGATGFTVPVYFLDTNLPAENSREDCTLTDWLYGGDDRYRLSQEVVLGIGGVRMLRALGYRQITHFHMNEGHASFLALELLAEQAARAGKTAPDADLVQAVRQRCVFTTRTPVRPDTINLTCRWYSGHSGLRESLRPCGRSSARRAGSI